MLIWLYLFLGFHLFFFVATWQLFIKAGRKAWEAAVPVYNILTALKIIKRPWWWIILFHIPIIMTIMWLVFWGDWVRSFGKRSPLQTLLGAVSLGLYPLYLNYVEKPEYTGPEERKSTLVSSLVFAIVLATTVHVWFIQPMVIPTGSMENTLLIGDALFVEKVSYGARVPFTPIGLPFAELIYRKAYLDQPRLPYMRLPGWRKLKQNDIVVFNYPMDSTFNAIDRRDPYVKRLVGMPGDVIEIDSSVLKVNGKVFQPKKDAKVQHAYKVETKQNLTQEYLKTNFNIISTDYGFAGRNANGRNVYLFRALTQEHIAKLKQLEGTTVEKTFDLPKGKARNGRLKTATDSANYIFPIDKKWNNDWYGPLKIPKKGDVVKLDKDNYFTYYELIKRHEGNEIEIKGDKIYINGKPTDTYTVQQDYFWMMGDNRDGSLDARYFGFVPENHIVGRPVLLWSNFNFIAGFEEKQGPRWERWFTVPNNGEPNKTSYRWIVLLLLLAWFGYDYWNYQKRKKKGEKD